MTNLTIRPAYGVWPEYNRRLHDVVAAMTDEQLAMRPSPERWPLWATVGHAACQRVFWLCDFAGEPGAETTPFTDAGHNCPGTTISIMCSARARWPTRSTFRIVEGCLDRWTLDMLDEELRRPEWDDSWVHRRGSVIQRVFSHDVYHSAELNETLGIAGLPLIDFWD